MAALVQDVIAVGVPEFITAEHLEDRVIRDAILDHLTKAAWTSVWDQWPDRKPLRLEDQHIDWLITSDPAEVDRFQPAHDCEQCRLGNITARQALADHPKRLIALGNIRYVPVWAGVI
jgi:hypothetical protein